MRTTKQLVFKILECLLLAVLFVCFIFPFYWMIITSFKGAREAIQQPPTWWPKVWVWTNFRDVFIEIDMAKYFFNSVVLSIATTASTMVCSIPAAYAFAKKKFFLKNVFFSISLLDLLVPVQAYFVGVFLLFSKMRILNTYISMVILYAYSGSTIFFLRNAFMQVQEEVLEAARLDGASEATTLFRVLLPMVKPLAIAVTMLAFISRWNSYFWYKVLTTNENIHTLVMGVQKLLHFDSNLVDVDAELLPLWNHTMAGNVMLMLPLLLLYIFANKKIKEAFVGNGIK